MDKLLYDFNFVIFFKGTCAMKKDELVKLGRDLFRAKKYKEALRCYSKAIVSTKMRT
jgi:hypothetical protein